MAKQLAMIASAAGFAGQLSLVHRRLHCVGTSVAGGPLPPPLHFFMLPVARHDRAVKPTSSEKGEFRESYVGECTRRTAWCTDPPRAAPQHDGSCEHRASVTRYAAPAHATTAPARATGDSAF